MLEIMTQVIEKLGAGNETRTRDPDLGKVVLYQLSYSRVAKKQVENFRSKAREVKANRPPASKKILYCRRLIEISQNNVLRGERCKRSG
jgi:hypothetical protein